MQKDKSRWKRPANNEYIYNKQSSRRVNNNVQRSWITAFKGFFKVDTGMNVQPKEVRALNVLVREAGESPDAGKNLNPRCDGVPRIYPQTA